MDGIASFVQCFDVVLKPTRGNDCTQLVVQVDHHRYTRGVYGNVTNVADKAGIIDVCALCTNSNNVAGGGDRASRAETQRRVVAAGGIARKRTITDSRVAKAGAVT